MSAYRRRSVSSAAAALVILASMACAACADTPEITPAGTTAPPRTANATTGPVQTADPTMTAVPGLQTPVSIPIIVDKSGDTLETRFRPPQGYERVAAEPGSFAEYLRKLPLKPDGAAVLYYDGTEKPGDSAAAIIDMDVGDSDLQQCADTVLRLYAEYLYGLRVYDRITFHFVSGFEFSWDKWRRGYRVDVDGNNVTWVKKASAGSGKRTFDAYLKKLYTYASTRSMAASDLKRVAPTELAIGDMFIRGGSPGHVVLVADMAVEPGTGRKCFMLLQGYMPAQDAHVLRNLDAPDMSPWVTLPDNPSGEFVTPEYLFTWDQTMRFKR